MKKLFTAHHKMMAATYRAHAEACDDGDAHKALFAKLAEHHHDLAEALSGEIDTHDDSAGVPGRKAMRSALDDIIPDNVRSVYPTELPAGLRMVPRAGGPTLEKAKVAPEHEQMFGNL